MAGTDIENTCLPELWEKELLIGMPSEPGKSIITRTKTTLHFEKTFEVKGSDEKIFVFPGRIQFLLANGKQAFFCVDRKGGASRGSFSAVVAYCYEDIPEMRIAVKCSTEGKVEAELAEELLKDQNMCGQVVMTFLGTNDGDDDFTRLHYYAMPYLLSFRELGIETDFDLREATEYLRKQCVCLLDRTGVPHLDAHVHNVMFRRDTKNKNMCMYLVDLASLLVHKDRNGKKYLLSSFPPPETTSENSGLVPYTENSETNLKYLSWGLGIFALQVTNMCLANRLHYTQYEQQPEVVQEVLERIQQDESIPCWIRMLLDPNPESRPAVGQTLWSPNDGRPKSLLEIRLAFC